MPAPKVDLVTCTQYPMETLLATWFNSRDEGETWTCFNLMPRLEEGLGSDGTIFDRLLKGQQSKNPIHADAVEEDCVAMLGEIIKLDVPILEFVSFDLSFSHVPRTFVDQLDRTRTAAFWEQSVRVKDLSKFSDRGDYFIPLEVASDPDKLLEYRAGMWEAQCSYNAQLKMGVRPELARGVIPMHVNVRADGAFTLRTLYAMVRKRACFFAQGSYWEPVLADIIRLVADAFPPSAREMIRQSFTRLPCDLPQNDHRCPYKRDIMDRLVDRSNPICPVLYARELNEDERARTVAGMDEMYTRDAFVQIGTRYLKAVRPQLSNAFRDDVLNRPAARVD